MQSCNNELTNVPKQIKKTTRQSKQIDLCETLHITDHTIMKVFEQWAKSIDVIIRLKLALIFGPVGLHRAGRSLASS